MSFLEDIATAINPASILGRLIAPLVDKLVGLIPDPQKRAELQLEISKLAQSEEFKQIDAMLAIASAQSRINEIEAQSTNLFKSGWRPAAGWCCVAGLIGQFLVAPTLTWFMALIGHPTPFPQLNSELLLTLLVGMLGLGSMRSLEKIRGVQS